MAGKIIVAGGSGFIGRALIAKLGEAGYEVVTLTRGRSEVAGARTVRWDGRTVGEWATEFEDAVGVINLSGETISQKWTPEAKRRIIGSRLSTARVIGEAISQRQSKSPFRWINASAVGFYGDRTDVVTESAPAGRGFLAETCVEWEAAVNEAAPAGCQVSLIRIGVVLGREGGAFPTLHKVTRLGLGGTVGKGSQGMPWIHLEDLAGLFVWVLSLPEPPKILNGTAPNPVTNAEFMATMRKAIGMPIGLPAPAFGVQLMGKTIGPDAALVLEGARVLPKAALDAGFEFKYPELLGAIRSLAS